MISFLILCALCTLVQSTAPTLKVVTNFNNLSYTISYATTQNFYRIYIDSASADRLGFAVNSINAKFLVENGFLYRFTGATATTWSWAFVSSVSFVTSGVSRTWSFSRSLLESTFCSTSYLIVPQVGDTPSTVTGVTTTQVLPGGCFKQKVAVPSYIYPGTAWTTMQSMNTSVGIALINPYNGPGSSYNSDYGSTTAATQAKGISVLGYVHTTYGQRNLSAVQQDIDNHYSWYNVDGIFVDETPAADCSMLSYYLSVYQYIKAKGGKSIVILNPGTTPPECYMNVSDIIANAETYGSTYLSSWRTLGYEIKYPASRFWHIIHTTAASSVAAVMTKAQNSNAGWVYVTSEVMPNPYGALPPLTYLNSVASLLLK